MPSTTRVDPINIDSTFRTSGSANDFTISLFNEVKNVFKVEIMSIDMPATTLNSINHSNNTLIVARNSLTRAYINIPVGSYTNTTLAAAIQTALNAGTGTYGDTTWVCTFAAPRYTISNFNVNFFIASDGLINRTIGYDNPPQVATGISEITQILCIAPGLFAAGEFVDINAENDARAYRFWFDTTGADGAPASDSRKLVRVDISTAVTNADVATIFTGIINTTTDFTAVTTGIASVVATNVIIGGTTDVTDNVADAGFTSTVIQQGNAIVISDGTTSLNQNNYFLVVSKALNPHQGVPSAVSFARIVHTIDSNNNTMNLNDGFNDYIIVIPSGQYNLYELAGATDTAINTQVVGSEALPIIVEYLPNSKTGNLDFIVRGNATITLSGTFVKSILNYYLSDDTISTAVKIYNPPLSATAVLIINPATDTFSTTSITVGSDAFKWRGAAKAPNGKIYFAPQSANSVLIIDTLTDTGDVTTIPVGPAGDGFDTQLRWSSAVTAPNGCIYFVPYFDRYWAKLDPATNLLNRDLLLTLDPTSGGSFAFWSDGVLVGTDIYTVPFFRKDMCQVIDTLTDTRLDIIDVGIFGTGGTNVPKWAAGVYVPDHDKIYFVPFWRNNIVVIDVAAGNAVSELLNPLIPNFGIGVNSPGYELYSDIVLAPNGKAYCIPFSEDFVLVLDMATDPPTFSSPVGLQGLGTRGRDYSIFELSQRQAIVNAIPNTRKWSGGVLIPGGFIYCSPLISNEVLIIDTNTDTYTVSARKFGSNPDKWFSGVLSDSYNIYQDSVKKSTAGHIIHKAHLNDPIGGRIVNQTADDEVTNFPQGYNIQDIDFKITDAFGNIITEMTNDWSMLIRVTHN
jgi:hypothetical protein